jgi:uncharacterized membrane protein
MSAIARLPAALLFMASGVVHLVKPGLFEAIVPPGFSNPPALVLVSGIAELAGGIGLLVPATRRAAAYGLIALLVAVFPANIYMAVDRGRFDAIAPHWLLIARLPLQPLLALWVWTLSADTP